MNKLNLIKMFLYIIITIVFYSICFIVKDFALVNITRIFDNPIFELDYAINTGAAFSIFKNTVYILAGFGVSVLFFIFVCIAYNTSKINYYRIILLAVFSAGIAANVFERLRYGYVTDYIKIKLFNFPIFNFQDILIVTAGILLIISCAITFGKKKFISSESDGD